jgi:hypothetical protein
MPDKDNILWYKFPLLFILFYKIDCALHKAVLVYDIIFFSCWFLKHSSEKLVYRELIEFSKLKVCLCNIICMIIMYIYTSIHQFAQMDLFGLFFFYKYHMYDCQKQVNIFT